jgi:hypothetical protein
MRFWWAIFAEINPEADLKRELQKKNARRSAPPSK